MTLTGSWILLSVRGFVDGGWEFPVGMAIPFALEACDMGNEQTNSLLANWNSFKVSASYISLLGVDIEV